ncbi:MAG: hypothetical protein ABI760_02970, partial [Ferruginibacter sp.]
MQLPVYTLRELKICSCFSPTTEAKPLLGVFTNNRNEAIVWCFHQQPKRPYLGLPSLNYYNSTISVSRCRVFSPSTEAKPLFGVFTNNPSYPTLVF